MHSRFRFSPIKPIALAALAPLAGLAQPVPPTAPDTSPLHAVRRELSPDALFFTYMDFEGGWRQVGTEISDTLKNTAFGDRGIDLPAALDELGLSQIRAIGMSSDATAGGYDNRFFLYTPAGRTGIFSLLPGAPEPFQVARFAPAGADFALDLRLDVSALVKTAKAVAEKLSAHREVAAAFLDALQGPHANGLPQILAYRGRIMLVGRSHAPERVERARAEGATELPFDFFGLIENGGTAFASTLANDPKWLRDENNGRLLFTPAPDDSPRQHTAVILIEGEHLAVATSLAFAEECLAQTGGLAADPSFTRALSEAASEGHMLVYMTPTFLTALRDASKWLFIANSGLVRRSAYETLLASELISMLPIVEKPLTSVVVARDDGILIRGHAAQSLKASLPGVAALTPDFLGRIATYAARAWALEDLRKHERERVENEFTPQLQTIGEAARVYFAAHPEETVITLDALKAAQPSVPLPDLSPVSSDEMEILRDSDVVAFDHDSLGRIEHVMPLTPDQRSTIEANLRAIDLAAVESMLLDASDYAYAGTVIEGDTLASKPVSQAGENYHELQLRLSDPRLAIATPGGQEIAVERDPKTVARARRAIAERRLKVEHNLARFSEAAGRYFEANPDSGYIYFDDLVTAGFAPEVIPAAGENYAELSFSRDTRALSLRLPRGEPVSYSPPPPPETIEALRRRLQNLERAAALYFAQNPGAALVVGGEILAEPAPADAADGTSDDLPRAVADGFVPTHPPDLGALVIRRDYDKIAVSLENGYEVSVPRAKAAP